MYKNKWQVIIKKADFQAYAAITKILSYKILREQIRGQPLV